jgi:hypothetical protein
MMKRHKQAVIVMKNVIENILKTINQKLWLYIPLITIEKKNSLSRMNFKEYGWNDELEYMRRNVTF